MLAYQMAIVASVDTGRRFSVLIPAAQAIGAMVGPLLGGWLVAAAGYVELLAVSAALVVGATMIFSASSGATVGRD